MLFLTSFLSIDAAVFTTIKDGPLNDAATYGTKNAPGRDDDIVINHKVYIRLNNYLYVNNVTVNQDGEIQGSSALVAYGNLTNNGIICLRNHNHPYLDVYGDLTNNGTIDVGSLSLGISSDTSLCRLYSAKEIKAQSFCARSSVIALSDLYFRNTSICIYNNRRPTLYMGDYTLTLTGDSITCNHALAAITYCSSISDCNVNFDNEGKLELNNSYIRNCTISAKKTLLTSQNMATFYEGNAINGDLILKKGSFYGENNSTPYHLRVYGNVENYANFFHGNVAVYNISGDSIVYKSYIKKGGISVFGNFSNYGKFGDEEEPGSSTIHMVAGTDSIHFEGETFSCLYIWKEDPSVAYNAQTLPDGGVVVVNNYASAYEAHIYAPLTINKGADLYLSKDFFMPVNLYNNEYYHGKLINNGTLHYYRSRKDDYAEIGGVDLELHNPTGNLLGYDIECHSGTHPKISGCINKWWRITPDGEDGSIIHNNFYFYYKDSDLNGQDESKLKLFRSIDKGDSWELLCFGNQSSSNYKLDTVNNYIRVECGASNGLSDLGDFILSSGDAALAESNVLINLVASSQVRVGAPNRYTVYVTNVGDGASDNLNVIFITGSEIRIHSLEIPQGDSLIVYPLDSLTDSENDPYNDIADKSQLVFIPSIPKGEEVYFNVVCYGIPDLKSISNIQDLDDIKLSPSEFGVGMVKDALTDAVIEEVRDGIDLKEEEVRLWEAYINANIRRDMQAERAKEGTVAYVTKSAIKYVAVKAIETVPGGKILTTIGSISENVYKMKDALRRRVMFWFYKEVGLFGVEKIDGKKIEGERVYSWDPNEMVGPAGYGENNYISEAGKMDYTILFENTAKATAPAYRIRIQDTLDANIFDIETVNFGKTSHSGEKYNWKMTRNGNILSWDIEGIELLPNITPPEGEGYVTFSVDTKAGLTSGSIISNRAGIIFDENPVIMTNTYVNILDTEAPTSDISAHYSASDSAIVLNISGSDGEKGSGVRTYSVYASKDYNVFSYAGESTGGDFYYPTPYDTTSFRFFIYATDNVGNTEQSTKDYINILMDAKETNIPDAAKCKLYPNPVKDVLNISLPATEASSVFIEVFNAKGVSESSGKCDLRSGSSTIQYDMSHLRQGLYIVKIVSGDMVYSEIFIKK